ncbi:MAG: lamin tail domain-containing protein [Phycisphaerae bacterium]|nr:lamin tail domain-containing protein [Phycisphaerae bacterium]NUQ49791.1 lamin tail domain-containing protein [Phycisphaerae bacterium]
MRITEYMYQGNGDLYEFIEFTNVGDAAVDMSGWSFDDNSDTPFSVDLSAFGTVAAGESVILTDSDAEDFRTTWGLSPLVKIIGGNTHNLGRNDAINLYDDLAVQVDRLRYGDQDFPGSIRARFNSGNPASPAALGANDPYQWVLALEGDIYGSWMSTNLDIGNPGQYIPEPASLGLLAIGGALLLRRR